MNFDVGNLLTVLFGLGGFYLGIRQDRHARQYDGAHQSTLGLVPIGLVTHDSSQPEPSERVAVSFRHQGFSTRHGITVCLTLDDGSFLLLARGISLQPGEEFGPKYLEIPRSDLQGLHLHVSWPSPHPSLRRRGLRYQALRADPFGELQEWRWHSFESLWRRLRLPLGKWKTVKNPPTDPKSMPGWPLGKAANASDL